MAERETITAAELAERMRARVAANPDRRPVMERIADLHSRGAHICARPGKEPTHHDLDEVEAFMAFLAAARRRPGRPGDDHDSAEQR